MRDPLEIVIIISDTFEDKLGIKKDSTKYLKETTNQPTNLPTLLFSDRYVQETNNIVFLALVPESSSKNCSTMILLALTLKLEITCNIYIYDGGLMVVF